MDEKNGKKLIYGLVKSRGKILFVEDKKGIWSLPEGRLTHGESEIECLTRTISEQFPEVTVAEVEFYREFRKRNPDGKTPSHAIVYNVELERGVEIIQEREKGILLTRRTALRDYRMSPITRKIIETTIPNILRNQNY